MSTITKCLIVCTICKIWTLANGLLIAWLHWYEKKHDDCWWAEPIAWSSGVGVGVALIFTFFTVISICETDAKKKRGLL